jgi:hypothetical protein
MASGFLHPAIQRPHRPSRTSLINAAITLNDCMDDAADKPGRSGRRTRRVPR